MSDARENTRLSAHLILFYASCAVVSIGAAMAALGFLVFTRPNEQAMSMVLRIVGLTFVVGGIVGTFYFLDRARRPEAS